MGQKYGSEVWDQKYGIRSAVKTKGNGDKCCCGCQVQVLLGADLLSPGECASANDQDTSPEHLFQQKQQHKSAFILIHRRFWAS